MVNVKKKQGGNEIMISNNVFERYEIKYLVTNRQRRIIMEAMQSRMKPDDYGKSTICNIYYDTPDYYLIRRSLEKPVYKEKHMPVHIKTEAERCLQCKKPLCQQGCPVHTPIPQVIALFRENRLMEAGELLFRNNHRSSNGHAPKGARPEYRYSLR